jgi:hypothetical protein
MDNIEELINNYILYYKKTYPNNNKNMFDNINYDDLTSTNHMMEMFYSDLLKYKNSSNNSVYDNYEDFEEFDNSDKKIYGLQINNNIKYMSYSVISLLYILTNIKDNKDDWNIINMK